MDDQRWRRDHRQNATYVVGEVHVQEGASHPGGHRVPLELGEALNVCGAPDSHEGGHDLAGTPGVLHPGHQHRAKLLGALRAGASRPQHQRRHTLGVCRGEEGRHGRAVRDADDRRTFDPFGIHHRA
jgi:hypothetical protein